MRCAMNPETLTPRRKAIPSVRFTRVGRLTVYLDCTKDGRRGRPKIRIDAPPAIAAKTQYRDDRRTVILVAMTDRQSILLDARAMDRTLRPMADEIVELNDATDDLIIVGIQRRAVQLSARIVSSI